MAANLLTVLLVIAQAFAAVQGTVVRAGTDSPVAGAQVVLLGQGPSRPSLMTTSDEAGKFSFDHVPPGEYRLAATAEGYVNNSVSLSAARPVGQPLTLRDGQEIKNIVLPLTPLGAIHGHLVGRSGDPMVNAEVQALRYSYRNQVRELSVVAAGKTNTAGEFRIDKLTPGSYIVRATGRTLSSAASTPVSPVASSVQGLVCSYFPGSITSETATPIAVPAGVTYTGVDWTAPPLSPVRIRGKAINALTGQPLHITTASIALRDSDNQTVATTASGNDGNFEFRSVSPGSYTLSASISGSDETKGLRVAARMRIDVGDKDIDDSLLVLQPGFNIAGRIVFSDGTLPAGDNPFRRKDATELRTVPWQPQLSSNFPYGPSRPEADGTFAALPGVLPGAYRLSVTGTPPNQYVKTARFGSAESAVRDPIRPSVRQFDGDHHRHQSRIVRGYSPGSWAVACTRRYGGSHTRRAVPRPARYLPRWRNRRIRSCPDFRAGAWKYTVFALEGLEPGAWFNPDFLRLYEDRGRAVELEEGKNETLKLSLIPPL